MVADLRRAPATPQPVAPATPLRYHLRQRIDVRAVLGAGLHGECLKNDARIVRATEAAILKRERR
jgi:hypothetical protein